MRERGGVRGVRGEGGRGERGEGGEGGEMVMVPGVGPIRALCHWG